MAILRVVSSNSFYIKLILHQEFVGTHFKTKNAYTAAHFPTYVI